MQQLKQRFIFRGSIFNIRLTWAKQFPLTIKVSLLVMAK